MNIRQNFALAFRDRSYVIVTALCAVLVIIILITGAIFIRPSDLQEYIRYSGYGVTHFYRDKWFYKLSFMVFVLIILTVHTILGVRLYVAKGRSFALSFLWLTASLLAISTVTIFAILRLVTFSQ